MIRFAFIVLFLAHSSNAFASKFYCQILDGKDLDFENGKLKAGSHTISVINERFVVDKSSGKIIKGMFRTLETSEVTVLDKSTPNERRPFKVITIHKPLPQLSQLTILSNHNPIAFVYHAHYGSVFTGICVDG